MNGPPKEGYDRALIVLRLTLISLALIIGFHLVVRGGYPLEWKHPRYAILACLPLLVLAAQFLRSRDLGAQGWGWARGVSIGIRLVIIGVLLLGTVGQPIVLLTMWTSVVSAVVLIPIVLDSKQILTTAGAPGLMVLMGLYAIQHVVGSLSKQAKALLPEERVAAHWLTSAIGFCTVVGFSLITARASAVADFYPPKLPVVKEQRGRDLAAATAALVQLQRCAARFADESPARGYPPSMKELGPGALDCLDGTIVDGEVEKSVVRYVPDPPDANGRVARYWALARTERGTPGSIAYLADHTGALFQGEYNPAWERVPPDTMAGLRLIHSPVRRLMKARECITTSYGRGFGILEYPEDVDLVTINPSPQCITAPEDANAGRLPIDTTSLSGGAVFNLVYAPGRAAPYITSFQLYASPARYGEGSVRSFLVDTLGRVHFTTLRRQATIRDPEVEGCEANPDRRCGLFAVAASKQ